MLSSVSVSTEFNLTDFLLQNLFQVLVFEQTEVYVTLSLDVMHCCE